MNMKENILIALDQLGIGGVETYVVNQVRTLKKMGYNITVMAKKGFYVETIKKLGAKFIDYEFKDELYFDSEEIEKVKEIIEKNKITQVHINQFLPISVMLPACIETNTPYVSYLHMGLSFINNKDNNPFEYFEKQYITYKNIFKMYFENSKKIIVLADPAKDYIAKKYKISKNKILVQPNSIDLDVYKTEREVTEINKIFVIGRLAEEKKISIENAIELYKEIKQINKKASLTIAGDGPIKTYLEDFVKERNIKDVKFIGAISNVKEVLDEQDLVIGLARCLLEGLTMKKLAVISGYQNVKGLIKGNIYDECKKDNFTGKNLKEQSISSVAKEITSLSKEEISNIINENYKRIQENHDSTKIMYILNKENENNQDYKKIISDLIQINEILGKEKIKWNTKADEIWKTYKEYEKKIKKKYGLLEKSIEFIKAPRFVIRKMLKKSN